MVLLQDWAPADPVGPNTAVEGTGYIFHYRWVRVRVRVPHRGGEQ